MVAGRRWDVSPLLKSGAATEATVRVATTLRNAVPGIALPYSSMRVGLFGLVALVPFRRARSSTCGRPAVAAGRKDRRSSSRSRRREDRRGR